MADANEGHVSQTTEKWYRIDRKLLPIKAFYFFTIGGTGCLYPFLALYMKHIGLTPRETGIIHGTMPIIGFLIRPIIGIVADKMRMNKVMLIACCILNGAFHLLLLLVPDNITREKYLTMNSILHCNRFNSYIHDCVPRNISRRATNCPLLFSDYVTSGFYRRHEKPNKSVLLRKVENAETSNTPRFHGLENHRVRCAMNCSRLQYVKKRVKRVDVCFHNKSLDNPQHCDMTFLDFDSKWRQVIQMEVKGIILTLRKGYMGHIHIDSDSNCTNFLLHNITFKHYPFFNMICSEDLELLCRMRCTDVNYLSDKCVQVDEKYGLHEMTATFWFCCLVLFLSAIFSVPIFSFGDVITYNIIKDETDLWSKQKLWGTLGFAVFTVITTLLIEIFSNQITKNYNIAFYNFILLMVIAAVVSCGLHVDSELKCEKDFKLIIKLFKNTEITVTLLVMTFFGFMHGVYETFVFWFLQDKFQNDLLIIPGVTLLISCTSETVMSFSSGSLIKWIGHHNCLFLGFLAFAGRFICYSFITNAWHILAVEILYGVNIGLILAAMTSYTSVLAPPDMFSATIGLSRCLHFGFGKGAGSIVTGLLYSPLVLGITWTFRVYSIVCIFALVLYVMVCKLWLDRRSIKKRKATDRHNIAVIGNERNDNLTTPAASKSLLDNTNEFGDGERSFSGISLDSRSEDGCKNNQSGDAYHTGNMAGKSLNNQIEKNRNNTKDTNKQSKPKNTEIQIPEREVKL